MEKLISFKTFTAEVELIANKTQTVDIPINVMAGYTAHCFNFCAFTGHAISTCLNSSKISESVRGTVRSDTNGTYSIRAFIMYIEQIQFQKYKII